MRKVTAILTALFLLVTMAAQPVMAGVTGADTLAIPEETDLGDNLAVWSTYMFFTDEDGIDIVDVKGGTVEATWTFANGEIPGISVFEPIETLVTDDYIIVSNGLSIAVLKNAKGFSNELPELAVRITKDFANSESFGSVKKMVVSEDKLYIFARATSGEAEVFKMDLATLEDIAYEDEGLMVISAEANAEKVSLGNCDYMWNKIKDDGEKIWAVTYNNEGFAPQKTIILNSVDMETLEVQSVELLSNGVNGFFAKVSGVTEENEEALMASTVYQYGSDLDNNPTLEVLCDAGYAEVTYSEGGAEVRITSDGILALASIFGCTTLDIKENKVSFLIDCGGKTSYFTYNENDDIYEQGTIAIDGDNIFVHTNSGSTANKLIVVSSKNDELDVINTRPAINAQGGTGANDMICIDDMLIALYRNADTMAVVYDISRPGDIPYNISENIRINGTIKVGDYAEIVKWGNGYYYLATTGNGVGVIKTDGTARTANISYTDGKMPIKLYGFGVDGEEVSIKIDGDTASTTVENGLWSYDIHAIENGEHEFEVKNGKKTTFEVDVDVPDMLEAEVSVDEYFVNLDLTNNLDKYAKIFESESFLIRFYEYYENGELAMHDIYSDTTLNLAMGSSTPNAVSYPQMMMVLADGGYIEIVISDENGNPVTDTITVYENRIDYGKTPRIFGDLGDITMEIAGIDYPSRKLTVKGKVETDCERLVLLDVTGGIMSPSNIIKTNSEGGFTYEYIFPEGEVVSGATYNFKATAIGGEGKSADAEYVLMSKDEFESALGYIDENIADGEALIAYLEENEQIAQTIGVNFESEDYIALSGEDKIELMGDVLSEIKKGKQNVANVFKDGAADLRLKARAAAALEALKAETTTKATLTGVLEEYNDVFEISESFWKKYSKDKKIQDINKKFLTYNITDVSKVAEKLKDAYDYVYDDKGESTGGGNNSGKVNPSGGIGDKVEIDVSIANGNTANAYNRYFDDLADAQWAVKAINALAERGIVNGVSGKTFNPNGNVTREEFVKMLVEALGLYDTAATTDFADVSTSHWAYSYIASAQKCGLTKGVDGNSFGLGQLISREEMATMAYRAMIISGQTVSDGDVTFADKNQISNYALDAVGAMSNAGILNGVGDNLFAPKDICSRAMAAKVVYEIIY